MLGETHSETAQQKRAGNGAARVRAGGASQPALKAQSWVPRPGHSPHKRESAALSRESVAGDVNISHLPAPLEHAPQVLRRGAVREVVYFQGHHAVDAGRRATVAHFGAGADTLVFTEVKANRKRACDTSVR